MICKTCGRESVGDDRCLYCGARSSGICAKENRDRDEKPSASKDLVAAFGKQASSAFEFNGRAFAGVMLGIFAVLWLPFTILTYRSSASALNFIVAILRMICCATALTLSCLAVHDGKRRKRVSAMCIAGIVIGSLDVAFTLTTPWII